MADNTVLNSGSGGDTIATDEISGVKHQRVKVQYGDDGSATDVSPQNPLPTISMPEIAALGTESTKTSWHRFGQNDDLDLGTEETCWSNGGTWFATPNSSAETVNIVSTSISDDGSPAGTGAQTVEVYGLDGSYAVQTETITMNGSTPVGTASTYIVIYRMVVSAVGSATWNVGTITATGATSSRVHSHIPANENQSLQCTHVIPASTTGLLYGYHCEVDSTVSTNEVQATLRVYDPDNFPLWRPISRSSTRAGKNGGLNFVVPLKLAAKTWLRLDMDASANNTAAYGSFSLVVDG